MWYPSSTKIRRQPVLVPSGNRRGSAPNIGMPKARATSRSSGVVVYVNEYHAALGDLIFRFEGTLEHFAGDGLMVFFNDPMPCDDAPARAIRMTVAMRTRMRDLVDAWARRGHDLAFAAGVAQGYATLGRIGLDRGHDVTRAESRPLMLKRPHRAAEPG
jgi:adenylate cyclase